jgi:carbonic anhydrase/acetyltransferase-like protein (isoleucine patch superfamily)
MGDLRASVGARHFLQPGVSHGAETTVKNVSRISTIEKNMLAALCANECESLVGCAAVVEHERHVGDWCGIADGAPCSRESAV